MDEVNTSPRNGSASAQETRTTPPPVIVTPTPDDTPDSSGFWRLVHEAPPEMFGHVLDKLPPEDMAMLSRVDSACCQHAVVRASTSSRPPIAAREHVGAFHKRQAFVLPRPLQHLEVPSLSGI